MPRNIVEALTGAFEDKRRWRAYRRRVKALPEEHRTAAEAVERYLMRSADSPTGGDAAATMYEGLIDLFEQAAADGTPVRDVVGDDPVEFADTFARTYSDGGWNVAERRRLRRAVDPTADGDEP